VEEYLEQKIRTEIIRDIENLELPYEWKPQEVINYILKRIKKHYVE